MNKINWRQIFIPAIGFFLFFVAFPATTRAVDVDGSTLYKYASKAVKSTLYSDAADNGLIIPKGATQIDRLYVFIHGCYDKAGTRPTAEDMCGSKYNLCKAATDLNTKGIKVAIALPVSKDPKGHKCSTVSLTNDEVLQYLQEVKNQIANLGNVQLNAGASLILVGHSAGTNYVGAMLNAGAYAERTIVLDGCYTDWCKRITNSGNSGPLSLYFSAQEAAKTEAGSTAAFKAGATGSTLFKFSGTHEEVPQSCFLEHALSDKCQSKATDMSKPATTAETNKQATVATNGGSTAVTKPVNNCSCTYYRTFECESSEGMSRCPPDVVSPEKAQIYVEKNEEDCKKHEESDKDHRISCVYAAGFTEIQKDLQIMKPILSIKIPGLTFSDVENKTDAAGNIFSPYLGEYIAAIYRLAIGIASIVAVIMIIISGIQIVTSGGGERKMAAYKRIGQVIVGLALAWGSFAILSFINPNLTRFAGLGIQYIQPNEMELADNVGEEESAKDTTTPAGNAGSSNRTYSPSNLNDFCFPVSDGYKGTNYNWGGRRPPDRCHAGIDLYTEGNAGKGTVRSMTKGTILYILEHFYDCKGGASNKTTVGKSEVVSAIYIYDEVNKVTYIYGEINRDSINRQEVQQGKTIEKGTVLGVASKCEMLHLEIFKGQEYGGNAYKGTKKTLAGQSIRGWLLFDEYKSQVPGGIQQGYNVCVENPVLYSILDKTNSKILDPRSFIKSIMGKKCN